MQSRFDQGRRSTEDSDNEEIVYRGHSRKALGSTTQWQYRRYDRSNTDDDKAFQPRMAPTCVDAQKAENFRKFYRAVVSPTHVRVTAGGRIVPNSRAPAQPVFVWNKDRVAFDTVVSSSDAAAQLNPENYHGPKKVQSMGSSFDSVGMTSSRSSYQKSDSSATAQSLETRDVASQHAIQGSMAQSQSTLNGIKLSSPANFDPNKPFMLNGIVAYPVPKDFKIPQGMSVMPLTMIGNPIQQQAHYQPQQQAMGSFRSPAPMFTGQPQQTQNSMQGTMASHLAPHQATRQFISGVPSAPQTNVNTLYHPKSTPAMRSAPIQDERMSPKALNQRMVGLQSKLDELDHQLMYNKHQIDEAYNNAQRNHIRSQISEIKDQLTSMGFAPMVPQARTSVQNRRGTGAACKPLQMLKPDLETFSEPENHLNSTNGLRIQESHAGRLTASESLPTSGGVSLDLPLTTSTTSAVSLIPSSIVTRTRLSASAAKAPEFKPRSMQAPETVTEKSDMPATVAAESVLSPVTSTDSMSPDEFGGYTTDNIRTMDDLVAAASRVSASLPPTDLSRSPYKQSSFNDNENVLTSSSASYQPAPLSLQTSAMGNVGPYLSGYSVPGVNAGAHRDQQFTYSRPLTEQELKARELYWGNGGKQHQQKGLPKFDGKDFYPPSPTKPSAISVSQSRSSETSTIVRKWNSSIVTSKASEESGVLQKLDEEDALVGPVTPRKNQLNRKVSAQPTEQKDTEDNKENVEVVNTVEELDAWCIKNGIQMPDVGTPVTKSKTASLLAKMAGISSPRNRMLKNAKPASVIAAERLESYGLPKLLAPTASRALAVASQEFATAKPSPATQRKAFLSIAKYTNPTIVESLLVPVAEEGSKPVLKTVRSVSAAPVLSDSDKAEGQFAQIFAQKMAARGVKVADKDGILLLDAPKAANGAAASLQQVAANDARRTLRPMASHDSMNRPLSSQSSQASRPTSRSSQYSTEAVAVAGPRVRTQASFTRPTAVEALAASLGPDPKSFLALPQQHQRAVSNMGLVPYQQQYQTRVPSHSRPLPLSQVSQAALVASVCGAMDQHGRPLQVMNSQMQMPVTAQFQGGPVQLVSPMFPPPVGMGFPPLGPFGPYQPGPAHLFPGPMQPPPGQEGDWVWHPRQGGAPPGPRQGPPPAR